jgi:photosynthetic reaction center M subunit
VATVIGPKPEPIQVPDFSPNDYSDPLGIRLGAPFRVPQVKAWFGVDSQFGTIWLGTWGVLSIATFVAAIGVWLWAGIAQMQGDIYAYIRYFANITIQPPDCLCIAPSWQGGGWWEMSTVFLVISVLAWAGRCYERLVRFQWRPYLLFAYLSAMSLTATIWIFRPLLMGTWKEAPAYGLFQDVNWAQNFSVLWGNLYYNPWHMLAIFFLFGSTMLWGMHGATILATSSESSHHEDAEIKNLTSGSQKAALFWKWTMGFNAFPKSIHDWLWWFAVGVVLSSGIGILSTGVVTNNWYVWGVDHGTVKQYGPITRSAINQWPRPMPPLPAPGGYVPAPGK